MRPVAIVAMVCALFLGATAVQASTEQVKQIAFEELNINLPDGWQLKQSARSQNTLLAGVGSTNAYVTIYATDQVGLNMQTIFVNGSTVSRDIHDRTFGALNWKMLHTSKRPEGTQTTNYITAFLVELNGKSYYGFSRAGSAAAAEQGAVAVLSSIEQRR